MKTQEESSVQEALGHVDQRRRGFLAKLLAGTAAVVAVPAMTSIALAQDDAQDAGKGKGGKGKGGKGKGGKGTGGEGQSRQSQDPATMAKQWIKDHDKDKDGKLSLAELTAAFTAMQQRRGGGRTGGGKGKGGGGKGKGGGGKGKGGGAGKGKGSDQ